MEELFSPESHIELQGCIAQAADLNVGEWKNRHHSIGELGVVATFAENLLDVASITELQAPLLICHGLGDVRCPIESIQGWAKAPTTAGQPVPFIATPEGHTGILASSAMYSVEECEIRLNIVRRFFKGAAFYQHLQKN